MNLKFDLVNIIMKGPNTAMDLAINAMRIETNAVRHKIAWHYKDCIAAS